MQFDGLKCRSKDHCETLVQDAEKLNDDYAIAGGMALFFLLVIATAVLTLQLSSMYVLRGVFRELTENLFDTQNGPIH